MRNSVSLSNVREFVMYSSPFDVAKPLGVFELEHVPCDLCGSWLYRIRYAKPDSWLRNCSYQFPIVECTDCGLVYVNPRPTPSSMSKFYPLDYHEGRDDLRAQARYDRQMRFLSLSPTECILDIGCARGDFLSHVQQKYPNIKMVGVDAYSNGVTNRQIEFHQCTLPEAPLADGRFDTITSWAVFEHLHSPRKYFETVKRLLKPSGTFVFLVTNSESLYGERAYKEDIPRHTYHFSKKTLRKYAETSGFTSSEFEFCDDVYDGRGYGTLSYGLQALAGWNWENEIVGTTNVFQKMLWRLGSRVDSILFRSHWESKKERSGIVVATFHA